jgi:Protein of unknown function (DUF3631)
MRQACTPQKTAVIVGDQQVERHASYRRGGNMTEQAKDWAEAYINGVPICENADRAWFPSSRTMVSRQREMLVLMDRGLSDDEIILALGPNSSDLSTEILQTRSQWAKESEKLRAHARVELRRPRTNAQTDGAALLDEVSRYLGRFIAYPSEHARVAHVLWIAHTHSMHAWESTPRLAALSKEPGSGKTRVLEVSEPLVPNPIEAVNVSPAYLFRKVVAPEGPPTILYDEVDTVFGPKAKENEEIRGFLNAGHRKGAVAGRCVVRGKVIETEEIPAYCAVALAGLGNLPDTILSRAIVLRMRRRAPNEKIEPFRRRIHFEEGNKLRARLSVWAANMIGDVINTWPSMPAEIQDRDADVWEPLLAVADIAGGDWPGRAREAAVALVALAKESTPSLGIRLLSDLRNVFGDADALFTEIILRKLHALDEAPWGEIKGKPLNDRQLARWLRGYEVKPKPIRIGEDVSRGYTREDLLDAWKRYLPPLQVSSVTNVTSDTKQKTIEVAELTVPSSLV